MMNLYADHDCDLSRMLHGASRLHVQLGRMDGEAISTRGWSYNDLVDGALMSCASNDISIMQWRTLDVVFDTLDALTEIGPEAVRYLRGYCSGTPHAASD